MAPSIHGLSKGVTLFAENHNRTRLGGIHWGFPLGAATNNFESF